MEIKYQGQIYKILSEFKTANFDDWLVVDFMKFASMNDWRKIWVMMKEVLGEDIQGGGGTKINIKKERLSAFDMLIGRYRPWFN